MTIHEKQIAHLILGPDRADVPSSSDPNVQANPPVTEVFNFREKWHVVQPFLNDPHVAAALARHMDNYIEECRAECEKERGNKERWEKKYDPAAGPWSYTKSGYWKGRSYDLADDVVERGDFHYEETDDGYWCACDMERFQELMSEFNPKPGSVEWYQLQDGGVWLAPWLRKLGKRAFPKLTWKIAKGQRHAFAFGTDGRGNIVMILDVLHFEKLTAEQLVDLVNKEEQKNHAPVTNSQN